LARRATKPGQVPRVEPGTVVILDDDRIDSLGGEAVRRMGGQRPSTVATARLPDRPTVSRLHSVNHLSQPEVGAWWKSAHAVKYRVASTRPVNLCEPAVRDE